MLDDFDPRDRDDDVRDIEMPWIELGRGPSSDRGEDDPRERADDTRELLRHADLLKSVDEWTIRVLLPRRFLKAGTFERVEVRSCARRRTAILI